MAEQKNLDGRRITRRSFLKATAATAGAISLGHSLFEFKNWAQTRAEAPLTRIPTICNGCGNRCGIFGYVKNGRIWKIEGNPEANGNLGGVCPRGHGYLHDLYNPDRLKGPLKRIGNKFEPIPWEQAYKEISQKVNLILMDSGPQSIFWVNYPQPNHLYALRLMHSLGSPHYFSHGSTCYTARNAGWVTTVGELPSNDLSNSRYIMIIGRNPAGGIDLAEVRKISEAKGKGAKVVVVDPRHSETAILADEWLPVKPGTDLAFLLAMINVMVKEELYDKRFVKAKAVGFEQLEDEIINYPPEWAEKVCEIPAKTITRLAREMAEAKPRCLIHRGYHGAFGSQYLNSFQTVRALAIANALLGNIDRKGWPGKFRGVLSTPFFKDGGFLREGRTFFSRVFLWMEKWMLFSRIWMTNMNVSSRTCAKRMFLWLNRFISLGPRIVIALFRFQRRGAFSWVIQRSISRRFMGNVASSCLLSLRVVRITSCWKWNFCPIFTSGARKLKSECS